MFFPKFGVRVIGSRWLSQIALHLSIKQCRKWGVKGGQGRRVRKLKQRRYKR